MSEAKESLWWLAASPLIWAAHLLVSYGTAAVFCAKFQGEAGSLRPVQLFIFGLTAAALVGIGLVGLRGWKRHRLGGSPLPHDADTPEDRYRFLGFASALLSGVSGIAVVYAALPAVFIGSCR
jgi:hypothetical protein